jgi:PAS domain S-box-containing protein
MAAAPLRSADGELLGVLAGRMNLDEMNTIINRHAGLWQTEEAFLVNSSNLFVTQPRLSPNPAVLQHGIHTEAVNRCLVRSSGTLSDLDYRGKPALIVYRWLPENDLCLVVKIDQAEALAPAYAFGRRIAFISGLALLGAIILAILFSRGITGPIRTLQVEVIRFGQGEQDIRLPEKGRDELGDLAREFNHMAASLIEKDSRLHEYATELERKVEERTAAIKQREERLRSYFEVAGQLGWTTNPQGEVEEDIPTWREYTGQSEEEVKGWGWSQALHPDDLEHATQVWREAITSRSNYEVEYRVRRFDGVYRYFLTRGVPVYKDNGEILEWVGTCIDITERKQTEEEIANLSKFPTENPNPVLRVQNDGRVVYANKASRGLLEMWGCEVNGCLPENMKELLLAVLERGEYKSVDIPCKEEVYSITLVPVAEAGYINMYGSEITERKHAEDDLKRSNAELEQFAYVASHDLQEPLRGVAGMAELLQQRYQGQLDGRADEYITHIVDGSQRMKMLINDLLAYSRVGRRGEPIQTTEAGVALQATLENLSLAIQEYGARITNEDLPTVQADPTQLIQLFQNLIGNALKFRAERPPQIHVGVEDVGEFWQFSVRDNGIGIEPAYFERVFQVFQRLHTRREYKGTGIGLAICKKIVERHGGSIWVESEVGQGATFLFTLPKG